MAKLDSVYSRHQRKEQMRRELAQHQEEGSHYDMIIREVLQATELREGNETGILDVIPVQNNYGRQI